MPFRSEAQRRLIYARASAGVPWAQKFIRDSGHTAPEVRRKAIRKHLKKHTRRKHGRT